MPTLIAALIATPAFAAVYGSDKRVLVSASTPAFVQSLGLSVAAMIDGARIHDGAKGTLSIQAMTLGDEDNLCEDERFYDQPSDSNCSGFLVAPDLLMTAGHCVQSAADCDQFVWLFNHRSESTPTNRDLYRCRKIEKVEVSKTVDYALIRLDRAVVDREPLKLSHLGDLTRGSGLFALGYPVGLPLVYSPGGLVWDVTPAVFTAALDTFHKSSGSPVFNAITHEVEGMLIYGSIDYTLDLGGIFSPKCNRVYVCQPGEHVCSGEGSMPAKVLQALINSIPAGDNIAFGR